MRTLAKKYLGYYYPELPENYDDYIDEVLEEVKHYSHFKVTTKVYPLEHDPLQAGGVQLEYGDLIKLLDGCDDVMYLACTLGVEIEKKVHYYANADLERMVVFDACASAYVEWCCDEYEATIERPHTFKFCPGYGDVPLQVNVVLYQLLDVYRQLGVELNDRCLMIPQKSMIGIIGLGKKNQVNTCENCTIQKNCTWYKEGRTCYKRK